MLYTKLFFCIFLVFIISEVNAAPTESALIPKNSDKSSEEYHRRSTHRKHAVPNSANVPAEDPAVVPKVNNPKKDVEWIDPAELPRRSATPKKYRED